MDEDWNEIDSFNSLIRPRDGAFHDWKHMAYRAGTPTEYLYARNVFSVLGAFVKWLDQDDVILWWHSDSQKLFKKLEKCVLKRSNTQRARCLNEYVHAFLGDESKTVGGPYHLALSFGVPVDMSRTHCSDNDVYVLRKLLQAIEFPQKNLELPLVKQERPITLKSMDAELPYQYDVKMNRVHQRDCELIHYVQTKGLQTLKSSVQHGYKPCKCCSGEFRASLRERNRSTLERIDYTYTYTPNSKVFHKYSCKTMLSASTIMGTRKYEAVVATGRVPCKLCKPTPDDFRYLLTEAYK